MCRNDEPQVLSCLQFKSDCDLRGRLEERFGLLTSLAKLHGIVRKPVAIFFYEPCGSARSRISPVRDTPSRAREPVGITVTSAKAPAAPRRIGLPRPNRRSMWDKAKSK